MSALLSRLQVAGLVLILMGGVLVGPFCLYQRLMPSVPDALLGMGGDFTLQSAKGPVSLSDFRGKVVLLYFGYTHCPDACPMALGVMARALNMVSRPWRERVAGLFISVDPARDTPKLLRDYVRFFDRRIVGLTGTPQKLREVAHRWRADFSLPANPGDHYAVEHSTFIYLVNADGQVVSLFDERTAPEEMAMSMQRWLWRVQ